MTGQLREGRFGNGCTSYKTGLGETVVMVAGGNRRDSVERMTMTLDGTGTWEIIGRLPGKFLKWTR